MEVVEDQWQYIFCSVHADDSTLRQSQEKLGLHFDNVVKLRQTGLQRFVKKLVIAVETVGELCVVYRLPYVMCNLRLVKKTAAFHPFSRELS